MLLGDESDALLCRQQLVKRRAPLRHTGVRPMGQRHNRPLSAHQVVEQIICNQFAHLVVIAGGVDLHPVDVPAVAAKDRNPRVERLLKLIFHLRGVRADQHDGVGLGRHHILNAAGQSGEIVGSIDDGHACARRLQIGL